MVARCLHVLFSKANQVLLSNIHHPCTGIDQCHGLLHLHLLWSTSPMFIIVREYCLVYGRKYSLWFGIWEMQTFPIKIPKVGILMAVKGWTWCSLMYKKWNNKENQRRLCYDFEPQQWPFHLTTVSKETHVIQSGCHKGTTVDPKCTPWSSKGEFRTMKAYFYTWWLILWWLYSCRWIESYDWCEALCCIIPGIGSQMVYFPWLDALHRPQTFIVTHISEHGWVLLVIDSWMPSL